MHVNENTFTGKKIGLLGGTFNPPHLGHLMIAENAYHEFSLDEVWLLPLGTPPHKSEDIASREDREAMIRILAAERGFLSVCTLELQREGYTYTVETLRRLRVEKRPEDTFYYIIGTDTLFQLEHWREYREVFTYTEFICVQRPGTDMAEVGKKMEELKERFQKTIYLSKTAGPDISSTNIRSALRQGLPIDGMVPERLKQYLEEHNVYRV